MLRTIARTRPRPGRRIRTAAGLAAALVAAVAGVPAARAGVVVRPQAGCEFYGGANSLRLITPWLAVRFGLSGSTSVIAKYYNHNLSYAYQDYDEATETFVPFTRTASMSNVTGVVYHQKGKDTAWAAVSFFRGTDAYRATALDAGYGRKVLPWLGLETGVYLLREDSILWYPKDAVRKINLYSVKGALKVQLAPWLTFNPNIYLYKNSEAVKALSWSAGFVVTPVDPLAITIYWFRYSESAQYRFAGNYVSVGFALYY